MEDDFRTTMPLERQNSGMISFLTNIIFVRILWFLVGRKRVLRRRGCGVGVGVGGSAGGGLG